MRLSTLIKGITLHPGFELKEDPEIGSIHYRAQEARPGGLFIAVPGFKADGHDYIDQALSQGAAAVVAQRAIQKTVPVVPVQDSRKALSAISARFYGNPSQKLFVFGITGTNGKTSTAYLLERILAEAGLAVGVIGTINCRYAGREYANPVTTPESLDLQKNMADMLAAGITHVIMEVSSHAIALHRIDHCWLDAAVFTNLSQDHLDFHKDLQSYWNCKKGLFTRHLLSGPKKEHAWGVINIDDPYGTELHQAFYGNRITCGGSPAAQVRAIDARFDLQGSRAVIETPQSRFSIRTPLLGRHNIQNILCAVATGLALQISPRTLKTGIEAGGVIPGRLEAVPNKSGKYIFVDYAHTPDALLNVLSTLKPLCNGRLITVFGCGGDRDTDKRPQMGGISGRLSDLSIITSDNPRTEEPMVIINQIQKGLQETGIRQYAPEAILNGICDKGFCIEPQRSAAIRLAVLAARPQDVVLIAGKGHETYQIIGHEKRPFDDRLETRKTLESEDEKPDVSAHTGNKPGPLPKAKPKAWSGTDIQAATRGDLICGDPAHIFNGFGINSRTIKPGQMFIAICGERHDGHDFIPQVVSTGIKGILFQKDHLATLPRSTWENQKVVGIGVPDTTRALGDLAACNRKRNRLSVIAITGSNGKTTTRRMVSAVVSQKFNTLSTIGNFNNEIGLPLTLLQAAPEHEWGVVELGMNRPGEIRRLAEICTPDIGIITNIGPAHLEGLGSIEAITQAKGELLEKLNPQGIAFLNMDDPNLARLAAQSDRLIRFFGLSPAAEVRADAIETAPQGVRFILQTPEGEIEIRLRLPGRFMVLNGLAAAAVGRHLGISLEQIKAGLESLKPASGRMNIIKTNKGITFIDDTYNANPDSMAAALKTLTALKGDGRAVFIAGDMLELGVQATDLHRELGRIAGRSGLSRLCITGEFAEIVCKGTLEAGLAPERILSGTKPEIAAHLIPWLQTGDWVLVKGSRGMKMETVLEELKNWADQPE